MRWRVPRWLAERSAVHTVANKPARQIGDGDAWAGFADGSHVEAM